MCGKSTPTRANSIQSFNKYLMGTYYVPGMAISPGDVEANLKRSLSSGSLYLHGERDNKEANTEI